MPILWAGQQELGQGYILCLKQIVVQGLLHKHSRN